MLIDVKMLHGNQNWCIKLLEVKVIDAVENHGQFDVDLEKSLVHTFDEEPKIPGSPQRKTIIFPSCNVTPTKRKKNNIS
jgi:hypothetical protein